jgi:hypothetical protein
MSSTTPGSEPDRTHDDVVRDETGEPEYRPIPEADAPASSDERPHPVHPDPDPGARDAAGGAEPKETPDATARLDAAVERANTAPAASDADSHTGEVPEPVPADTVRRETYVPAATVGGASAGAATLAPEPAAEPYAPAPAPQTIYVQAPTPPKERGNRGFGVLVALIGTVLFALLYAGVAYLLVSFYGAGRDDGIQVFTEFLVQPVFWVPVLAFFIGFALLAAIVNRGAWWYYAVFGLLVAVLVYFSYIGGALLTVQAWTLTVDEGTEFLAQRWLDPFAIAAFIIAREIPIWLGGWIAARGRTVAERNRLASEAYERELAAGPQVSPR